MIPEPGRAWELALRRLVRAGWPSGGVGKHHSSPRGLAGPARTFRPPDPRTPTTVKNAARERAAGRARNGYIQQILALRCEQVFDDGASQRAWSLGAVSAQRS